MKGGIKMALLPLLPLILSFLIFMYIIGYKVAGWLGLFFAVTLSSPIFMLLFSEIINNKTSNTVNFNNRLILNKKDVEDFIKWTSGFMFIFNDKQNNLLCSIGEDNIFRQYVDNAERYAFQKAFKYVKEDNSRPFRFDDENNPDYGLTVEAYIWKHRDDINDKLKEIEAYKKEYQEKMELNKEFN